MPAAAASDVTEADAILVGGGLSASLIALRLKASRPNLKIIMLERENRIGGEHTWRHFAADVSPAIAAWLAPLIVHEWPGYEVHFPAQGRTLTTPYRAITSERLRAVISELLGPDVIEDTRYRDGPALDRAQLARDIAAYAALFHPTTGYSSPDAARRAETIAALPQLTTAAARDALTRQSKTAWKDRGYYRLLNRMLFRAAAPDQRYKVLERYRLPQPLIERVCAGEASFGDKLRILSGKPPAPNRRGDGVSVREAPIGGASGMSATLALTSPLPLAWERDTERPARRMDPSARLTPPVSLSPATGRGTVRGWSDLAQTQ